MACYGIVAFLLHIRAKSNQSTDIISSIGMLVRSSIMTASLRLSKHLRPAGFSPRQAAFRQTKRLLLCRRFSIQILFRWSAGKMIHQHGQKLCRFWPAVERMPRQLLQQGAVRLPSDLDHRADVPFHPAPCGVVLLCHLRVQPFRHHEKALRAQ